MSTIQSVKMRIINLYTKVFRTNRYDGHCLNVPVEKLLYYPDLDRMYMAIAYKGDLGSEEATFLVPENLHKVVMAHASTGRRVSFFFTTKTAVLGHIFFGEESHLEIKHQIDSGFRPASWGNPNSQDWQKWKNIQARFKHSDPGNEKWGFARIMKGKAPELTNLEDI